MSIANEAVMYAATYRFIAWVMILATTLAVGCRGTQKFGRQVQVSESSDAELAELGSPEQRIATSLRSEAGGENGDAKIAQNLEVISASLRKQGDGSEVQSGVAQTELKKDSLEKTSNATLPQQTAVSAREAKQSEGGDSVATTDVQDPAAVFETIKNLPSETRERLRQQLNHDLLVADQTAQPNPIDLESGAMNRLPNLPPSRDSVPEVTPSRLGVGLEGQNPNLSQAVVVASLKDKEPTALTEKEKDAVARRLLQNHVPNDKGTSSDRGNIRAVSATQSEVAHSRIVQAFSPELLSELSEDVLYDALAQQLSKTPAVEEPAERTARLIRLRHLMVLSGDPDAAVEKISGLSDSEQEFLRHQLLGLWTIIDPDGHPTSPSRRFTSAVPQIREAAKFAAAATDALEVRALAFCTDIQSYGQFKRFEGNRFDAGQQVILYCEIDNFTAKRVDNGFETHLQGSYDIYDSENRKVLSQLLPADQQVSANYLRDYFIAYQMLIPKELPAGTYKLRLTMEDRNGKKYGNADIPFEIAK